MSEAAAKPVAEVAGSDAKQCCCAKSGAERRGPGLDPELLAKVDSLIDQYKGARGALIPVLHQAQQLIGYLPKVVLSRIADGLGIPESEVYGVVTFYSLFTMKPAGRHKIGVCLGTACYVKGAAAVLEAVKREAGADVGDTSDDGRFGVEVTRCVGACGLAPVVTIDDDVYSRVQPDKVAEILAKYE